MLSTIDVTVTTEFVVPPWISRVSPTVYAEPGSTSWTSIISPEAFVVALTVAPSPVADWAISSLDRKFEKVCIQHQEWR